MENYRDRIKTTPKQGKNKSKKGLTQKGSAEMPMKKCKYLEILDKRIHIQQRALACQSKALSHVLQRDLYTMGNAGLIRKDAEMNLFNLTWGNPGIRNSPFCPSPLFHLELAKEWKEFRHKNKYS